MSAAVNTSPATVTRRLRSSGPTLHDILLPDPPRHVQGGTEGTGGTTRENGRPRWYRAGDRVVPLPCDRPTSTTRSHLPVPPQTRNSPSSTPWYYRYPLDEGRP